MSMCSFCNQNQKEHNNTSSAFFILVSRYRRYRRKYIVTTKQILKSHFCHYQPLPLQQQQTHAHTHAHIHAHTHAHAHSHRHGHQSIQFIGNFFFLWVPTQKPLYLGYLIKNTFLVGRSFRALRPSTLPLFQNSNAFLLNASCYAPQRPHCLPRILSLVAFSP